MSEVAQAKQLLHSRQVRCDGYLLAPECWQIVGRMTDIKSFAMHNPDRGGQIAVGEPLHDISLALTLNKQLEILAVEVAMEATPFNSCKRIEQAFQVLVGTQLLPGFHRQAKESLGGVNGCTHLLELLVPIATTAYQTIWQSDQGYNSSDPAVTAFLLDSCHALAADGEVVRQFADQMQLTEQQLAQIIDNPKGGER